MKRRTMDVRLYGRDELKAELVLANDGSATEVDSATADSSAPAAVKDLQISVSGCSLFKAKAELFRSLFLKLSEEERGKFLAQSSSAEHSPVFGYIYEPFQGHDHASILIRELILKLQNRFLFPYQEAELCHCRAVPTDVVDRAVVGGCHTLMSVARATSAGTSCGTCKRDTEQIIAFRLNKI